jgi:hypothetical protein
MVADKGRVDALFFNEITHKLQKNHNAMTSKILSTTKKEQIYLV